MEEEINLLDYIKVIQKRKNIILLLFFAAVITAGIVSLLSPKIYKAKTTILIPQRVEGGISAALAQMGGISFLPSVPGIGGGNFVDILKSRTISSKVIDELDLLKKFQKEDKKLRKWQLIGGMQGALKVEDKKSGLIEVSFEAKDPQLAADIANSYLGALKDYNQKYSLSSAKKNRRFIEGQLKGTKEKLKNAEESLRQFQEKSKTISLPAGTGEAIKGAADLSAQRAMNDIALKEIQGRLKACREGLSFQTKTQISQKTITDNPIVEELRKDLVNQELELANKLLIFTKDHPEIISLERRIAKTKEKLNQQIVKIISLQIVALNPIYEELKAKIVSQEVESIALQSRGEALSQVLARLPQESLQLVRLVRQVKIEETLWTLLEQEYEKAKISEDKEEEIFQVLDKAYPPKEKCKPKVRLNLAIAGVLSLFLGIFLSFFLEYWEGAKENQK